MLNAPDTLSEAGVSYFRDKRCGEYHGWTRYEYWSCRLGRKYANHVYTMTRRDFLALLDWWTKACRLRTGLDWTYEEKVNGDLA